MDFNYESTGGLSVYGCASYTQINFYPIKFSIDSIVYLLYKARKGVMERIAIRDVRLVGASYSPLYIGTANDYYNEMELGTYEEAIALAGTYVERYEQLLEQLLKKC